MSATTKLKWKKITVQLRYMYEELGIVKSMSDEAGSDFQLYYEEYCKKNNIDLSELNNKHNERIQKLYPGKKKAKETPVSEYSGSTALALSQNDEVEEAHGEPIEPEFMHHDEKEMNDTFSKLFRKLAIVLHPDKLENSGYSADKKEEMKQMFTDAKSALEEKRYFMLIDFAERLGIPTPRNYKQQIKWMKRELEKIRAEVAAVTRTYNYSFAETETDDDRDKLIKKFMIQVFGHDPTNNQQKDVDITT